MNIRATINKLQKALIGETYVFIKKAKMGIGDCVGCNGADARRGRRQNCIRHFD